MGNIKIDRHDAVATVTLDHPGKLNAISVAMWGAIFEGIRRSFRPT